ncbi:MAG: hypothetical protein U0840_25600 [Gemmataceae bacterium]
MTTLYLGTHKANWLDRLDVPMMVSRRTLAARKRLPRAITSWVLDSGGFTELSLQGRWTVPAMTYSTEVRRYHDEIGHLQWAAIQDWMCEPWILARTGLTVRDHQWQTIANCKLLRQLAPDMPWMPVLQGWEFEDYLHHLYQYGEAGIDLRAEPVVGLGSVCRRQDTAMAEELICELSARGIRLHAFGFKLKGLRRVASQLASTDSMAWSLDARRRPPLPGCNHASCANCPRYALQWRERALEAIDRAQPTLPWGGRA